MRFHKLVQSFDYVSYPSLIELKSINKKLGDTLYSIGNALFSTGIGIIFDIAPYSKYFIDRYLITEKVNIVALFGNYQDAKRLVAIGIAASLYIMLHIIRFFTIRFRSNKNTVDKRKEIVSRFYRVIIPKLISAKSIYEKSSGLKEKPDKRFLLLLQVKYELVELMHLLSRLKIIEKKWNNSLTHKSEDLLDQIDRDAYFAVLLDFINTLELVYKDFQKYDLLKVQNILDSLYSELLSSRPQKILCNRQSMTV